MKHTKSLKTLIVFAGGMALGLGVFLVANAYTISTSIANAVQYIARTVVTTDGSNTSAVLVDLNTGSNVYIANSLGVGKLPTEKLDINGTGKFNNLDVQGPSKFGSGLTISGKLGIGRDPIYNLTVSGSTYSNYFHSSYLRAGILGEGANAVGMGKLNSNSNKISITFESVSGYIETTNNAAQVFLGLNGNVGIGTENPQAKLDVNGTIKPGYSDSCDSNGVGSIRFNGTQAKVEVCLRYCNDGSTLYGRTGVYIDGINSGMSCPTFIPPPGG